MREKTPAAAPRRRRASMLRRTQEVDESALRYYASMRQTERVEAETLPPPAAAIPSWKPPGDLYRTVEPGGGDEEELWALFSLDKIAELHTAIEERKDAQPGWRPSRDLAAQAGAQGDAAQDRDLRWSIRSETEALFEFIKSTSLKPDELDLDVQWMLAEAYAKAKQMHEARAIYPVDPCGSAKPERAHRDDPEGDGGAADVAGRAAARLASRMRAPNSRRSGRTSRVRASAPFCKTIARDEVPAADVAELQVRRSRRRRPERSRPARLVRVQAQQLPEALELFKARAREGRRRDDRARPRALADAHRHAARSRRSRLRLARAAGAQCDPVHRHAGRGSHPRSAGDDRDRAAGALRPRRRCRTSSGEGAQALAWYAYNSCQFDIGAAMVRARDGLVSRKPRPRWAMR